MATMRTRVLVACDDLGISKLLAHALAAPGAEVLTCFNAREGERLIASEKLDVIFAGLEAGGFELLARARQLPSPPAFVLVMERVDPALMERAARAGASEVLRKPFITEQVTAAMQKALARRQDRLSDIMGVVQGVSGVVLGQDKRLLVETRLLRRVRQLGLAKLEDYFQYFESHRDAELKHLISLVTTHTTDFFREPQHFERLTSEVFAKRPLSQSLRLWSAASSTGQEAYSLAISYLAFQREMGREAGPASLEILGTDIDHESVQRARRGIYPASSLTGMTPVMQKTYFDQGSAEIGHLVKVKDQVHRLCRFEELNLLDFEAYPRTGFDAIFLRNVLIYFSKADIERIVNAAAQCLAPDGLFIIGHSESLVGLDTPLELQGNSVYTRKKSERARTVASPAKVRVVIVDDATSMRQLLRHAIAQDHNFEIVGEAEDGLAARELMKSVTADVMTLDIHMPRMTGPEYLEAVRGSKHPPVVMISSVSRSDAKEAMRCFDLGAVDYIEKPTATSLEHDAAHLCAVLGAAARQKRSPKLKSKIPKTLGVLPIETSAQALIALGASTGGIEALTMLIESLPVETPPVVVVQHIPPGFSAAFASRLAERCQVKVSEAKDGQRLERGHVYLAPGGRHMGIRLLSSGLQVALSDDEPVCRHRPSVDYLFRSLLPLTGKFQMAAALLTGMGADGAEGLLALRRQGVHTIAQDEETSVVYGMPKAAADRGAAVEILPLPSIAYHLLASLRQRKSA